LSHEAVKLGTMHFTKVHGHCHAPCRTAPYDIDLEPD
jgi:hypothetical protein